MEYAITVGCDVLIVPHIKLTPTNPQQFYCRAGPVPADSIVVADCISAQNPKQILDLNFRSCATWQVLHKNISGGKQ